MHHPSRSLRKYTIVYTMLFLLVPTGPTLFFSLFLSVCVFSFSFLARLATTGHRTSGWKIETLCTHQTSLFPSWCIHIEVAVFSPLAHRCADRRARSTDTPGGVNDFIPIIIIFWPTRNRWLVNRWEENRETFFFGGGGIERNARL